MFVTVSILVVYLLKGIGAYFSSYLMEGLGHRVVLDHQLQGTCICADAPGVESVVTAR